LIEVASFLWSRKSCIMLSKQESVCTRELRNIEDVSWIYVFQSRSKVFGDDLVVSKTSQEKIYIPEEKTVHTQLIRDSNI
jgi:hypothetical protein